MAEWDRDRTRESWEVAKAKAISRGVHIDATVPVGYRKTAQRTASA